MTKLRGVSYFDNGKSVKATTPKGREVDVVVIEEHGLARLQSCRLYYGGISVAGYSQGSGCVNANSLEAALIEADKRIDSNGITADISAMTVRDIPESLRLKFRGMALSEGKTMQQKIIEIMQEYVN